MEFNKVMVPVDGCYLSDVAVDIALHSANTFNSDLTFVYVVDPEQETGFGSVNIGLDIKKAEIKGSMVLEAVSKKADAVGCKYETVLSIGNTAKTLIEMTKQYNMAIMAIAGGSGLKSGRIGSTARKVIENAFCPILTVKSGSIRIKDVLLPVSNENMAAIDIAIDTVKRIDGNLTVMSVRGKKVEDAESIANKVAERCRSAGIEATTLVCEGDALDFIVAESGKFDLIIMGVEKAGGLKQILHGGLTERVVTMASCPVTVVRDF